MFMRYVGGGIGHNATEHIQPMPSTYKRTHEKNAEDQEEMADNDHTADHRPSHNECGEIDSDGINTDEEHQEEFSSGDSATRDLDTDQESTDRDEETFENYYY
jgi:hypothetical protein